MVIIFKYIPGRKKNIISCEQIAAPNLFIPLETEQPF